MVLPSDSTVALHTAFKILSLSVKQSSLKDDGARHRSAICTFLRSTNAVCAHDHNRSQIGKPLRYGIRQVSKNVHCLCVCRDSVHTGVIYACPPYLQSYPPVGRISLPLCSPTKKLSVHLHHSVLVLVRIVHKFRNISLHGNHLNAEHRNLCTQQSLSCQ